MVLRATVDYTEIKYLTNYRRIYMELNEGISLNIGDEHIPRVDRWTPEERQVLADRLARTMVECEFGLLALANIDAQDSGQLEIEYPIDGSINV